MFSLLQNEFLIAYILEIYATNGVETDYLIQEFKVLIDKHISFQISQISLSHNLEYFTPASSYLKLVNLNLASSDFIYYLSSSIRTEIFITKL